MKSLREKFQKIKFLIPLLVGGLVIFLIHEYFDWQKVGLKNILMGCILVIAISRSYELWKIVRDEDYKKNYDEFLKSEKAKPWHHRRKFLDVSVRIGTLQVGSILAIFFSLGGFVFYGLRYGIWDFFAIIFALICLLIFMICTKLLK